MTTPNEHPREIRIELELEVRGTPEQVWEAIATGPGIAAWFVPAEVAERAGGSIAFDMFGAGMEESGTVTAWDPPTRFAYEEEYQPLESAAAPMASEFLVEARSGGTCVVRIVNSVFASGADWERELESMREGWHMYLRNLRLYLTHFAGRTCSWIMVTGNAAPPLDRAWAELADALGLADAAEGDPVSASGPGTPALSGVVELPTRSSNHRGLLIRTDEPAPGAVLVVAFEWRDRVYTSLHAYLFGDEAAAVAERDAPAWRAWMDARFPAPEPSAAT
jgi:uncharacterized protein YndB with AHSA1/START domain